MNTPLSRRQLLAASALGSAGFIAGGRALASADPQLVRALAESAPQRPGSDIGAIKHVVYLMMENRSFDHIYGSLYGIRGFADRRDNAMRVFRQSKGPGQGHVLPYRYNTDTMDASCTFGPDHEWPAMQEAYNGGRPAFVASQIKYQTENPQVTGPMTMGYYTRKDLAYHYALADAFTVCDRYFCSVIGPTHPNRTYAVSGTLDPAGRWGGPCVSTSASNWQKFDWPTAPDLLQDAGVSWKVYAPTAAPEGFDSGPPALVAGNNILLAFKQFGTKGTQEFNRAFTNLWPNDFLGDVANDRLPAVSWVWPGGVPSMDEHPAGPVTRGAYGINTLLQALFRNRELWAKTLVVFTYDENGGYFDHVIPPTPPKGTPGEYLTVDPLPADVAGHTGPIGMGFRVPTVLMSPWSRGGVVSHQRFDHVSMLLFLEERFGIRFHTISKWRRKHVNTLSVALRMSEPNMHIPKLPAAPLTTRKILDQCTDESLQFEQGGSQLPEPATQRMPRQERGVRRIVRDGQIIKKRSRT